MGSSLLLVLSMATVAAHRDPVCHREQMAALS
ncbi:MAG: hypothetical protein N838_02600 [Thiohalocapsa sp. PB-PSB1]|nr:MAG: hypothetical protein N838_02600 [Thiohalocapsa sp. PB-PSB1]